MNMLEDNVIPFRFRIDNIPWLIAILFIVEVVFQYSFFFLQDRYTNYLPTLAETAVTTPNSLLLSSVVSLIAFLFLLVLTAMVTWGEVYSVFQQTFLMVGQIGALICTAFLLLFANFRLDDWLRANYVGGVPFLWTTLIFCFVICQQLFSQMHRGLRILRLVLLLLAALALVMSFIPIGQQATNTSMKSICELFFLVLMVVFLLTFRVELGQLKVDVVILFDEDK
jgi:hypothetical protein